ncbi:hypothetical protein [Ignatzschineria indica]|uniref:hypothetical protein n=1 Tax=Ignatzschineria indica TaxID=472583 RepID=UPI0013005C90|nr:hypothetical protein [Ignatzschineria indica]
MARGNDRALITTACPLIGIFNAERSDRYDLYERYLQVAIKTAICRRVIDGRTR